MQSDLDRKFDEILSELVAPGGRLIVGEDERGNAILTNFPATIPHLLRTFCALNAPSEAVVAGDERFTFAELDAISERVARGLVAHGIGKGDIVGIAMRNCPSWIVGYMVAAVPEDVLGKIVAKIPVGRLGKAEEIARGVAFLVDESGGFITGSTLSINGGQHMY